MQNCPSTKSINIFWVIKRENGNQFKRNELKLRERRERWKKICEQTNITHNCLMEYAPLVGEEEIGGKHVWDSSEWRERSSCNLHITKRKSFAYRMGMGTGTRLWAGTRTNSVVQLQLPISQKCQMVSQVF